MARAGGTPEERRAEAAPAALGEPETTEEALRAIEQTRGRISATLDAIEDRIETKREQIKERINVLRPARAWIRAQGWKGLAACFGAGLLLGLLTGGKEEERAKPAREGFLDESEREELRRWRAERRARLRRLEREGRRERRWGSAGGSFVAQAGQTLLDAAVGVFADRARRAGGR